MQSSVRSWDKYHIRTQLSDLWIVAKETLVAAAAAAFAVRKYILFFSIVEDLEGENLCTFQAPRVSHARLTRCNDCTGMTVLSWNDMSECADIAINWQTFQENVKINGSHPSRIPRVPIFCAILNTKQCYPWHETLLASTHQQDVPLHISSWGSASNMLWSVSASPSTFQLNCASAARNVHYSAWTPRCV